MDFKQAKEKKERGLSVAESFGEMNENKEEYKDIIMIGVKTTGQLDFSFSVDNNATALGLLEILKKYFLDEING